MGKRYLIDTNVLIDAQSGNMPESGLSFLQEIVNDDFTISFISYIEFLGYRHIAQQSKDFIALSNVIEINKDIIDTCIALRRISKIKLPDAIIAATALILNLTLLSRNTVDFRSISKLNVLDPHSL